MIAVKGVHTDEDESRVIWGRYFMMTKYAYHKISIHIVILPLSTDFAEDTPSRPLILPAHETDRVNLHSD